MRRSDIRVIDVTSKDKTHRIAAAEGRITMGRKAFDMCVEGQLPKGDVFSCAKAAAFLAAKGTSSMLPLCHPVALTNMELSFDTSLDGVIRAVSKIEGYDRTGFEMEALTAVSVALLTIYDMCKSVEPAMEIGGIRLLEKSGGKNDYKR